MLEEAVFVLSLSARAGRLGWGPLHRVLSGQGNKNLVCGEKPAQGYCTGPGSKHVCVKGLGRVGLEPSLGLSLMTALATTRRSPVRQDENRVSQRQNWKVSPGLLTSRASQVPLVPNKHAGCRDPFHSALGHKEVKR